MLKRLFCIAGVSLIATFFMECSDGDLGPKGDQGPGQFVKNGFYEGTITGTRKDGTPFTEAFKYEYADEQPASFYYEDGIKGIILPRYVSANGGDRFYMSLIHDGNTLTPRYSNSIEVIFNKELNAETLFSLYVHPSFKDREGYVAVLNEDQNRTYNFSGNGDNIHWSDTWLDGGVAVYELQSYAVEYLYRINYSQSSGALISIYDHENNTVITKGQLFDKYNQLKFKYNEQLASPVFYDAKTGEELFEVIPDVPADKLTITNYTHSSNGVLSFDFVLNISGYTEPNSTDHDLTIKGKFNSGGKVYREVVSRVRN